MEKLNKENSLTTNLNFENSNKFINNISTIYDKNLKNNGYANTETKSSNNNKSKISLNLPGIKSLIEIKNKEMFYNKTNCKNFQEKNNNNLNEYEVTIKNNTENYLISKTTGEMFTSSDIYSNNFTVYK